MLKLIAARLISLSHESHFRYFISLENTFLLLHVHDLVVAEVHICHGELQLHYSYDRKLNFALLLYLLYAVLLSTFFGDFLTNEAWNKRKNISLNSARVEIALFPEHTTAKRTK